MTKHEDEGKMVRYSEFLAYAIVKRKREFRLCMCTALLRMSMKSHDSENLVPHGSCRCLFSSGR